MKLEDWVTPENIGLVALGVVIGAIALIGVEAACDADVAARSRAAPAARTDAPSRASPIDGELLRCAILPLEQADDPACRALWAEQRRKFLAPGKRSEEAGAPLDIFPSAQRARETPAVHSNQQPSKSE
jgi:conjugative transfer region protein TrbK